MIEELQRFIKVANNGNLTQTAKNIYLTQSALSQSIKRLENKLGTKLFVQKGKTLHLTTDGIAVVQLGTKILDLWEKATDAKIRSSHQTSYTIGAFDNAALRLGKYLQKHMHHESFGIELTISSSQKLLRLLQLGVVDVAICVRSSKTPLPSSIILVETFTEELIPVSSHIYTEPPDQIPFILYNKGSHTREYIDEIFLRKGIRPIIFAESTSVTFMKELAMLGSGVALLPKNLIRMELQQKLLKKQHLSLAWTREYGLYISGNSKLTPHHQLIRELLRNLR